MASGVFLVVFWIYFHAEKRSQKSSGIPGFIFVKENGHKSSPWHHVLSNQTASD
jgi:hypothetical protein